MIAPQKNKPIEIIRMGLSSIQVRRVAPSSRIQAKSWEKIPSMSVMVPAEVPVLEAKAGKDAERTIAEENGTAR